MHYAFLGDGDRGTRDFARGGDLLRANRFHEIFRLKRHFDRAGFADRLRPHCGVFR